MFEKKDLNLDYIKYSSREELLSKLQDTLGKLASKPIVYFNVSSDNKLYIGITNDVFGRYSRDHRIFSSLNGESTLYFFSCDYFNMSAIYDFESNLIRLFGSFLVLENKKLVQSDYMYYQKDQYHNYIKFMFDIIVDTLRTHKFDISDDVIYEQVCFSNRYKYSKYILNDKQREAVDGVVNGMNNVNDDYVVLGNAGTGKTLVVLSIWERLTLEKIDKFIASKQSGENTSLMPSDVVYITTAKPNMKSIIKEYINKTRDMIKDNYKYRGYWKEISFMFKDVYKIWGDLYKINFDPFNKNTLLIDESHGMMSAFEDAITYHFSPLYSNLFDDNSLFTKFDYKGFENFASNYIDENSRHQLYDNSKRILLTYDSKLPELLTILHSYAESNFDSLLSIFKETNLESKYLQKIKQKTQEDSDFNKVLFVIKKACSIMSFKVFGNMSYLFSHFNNVFVFDSNQKTNSNNVSLLSLLDIMKIGRINWEYCSLDDVSKCKNIFKLDLEYRNKFALSYLNLFSDNGDTLEDGHKVEIHDDINKFLEIYYGGKVDRYRRILASCSYRWSKVDGRSSKVNNVNQEKVEIFERESGNKFFERLNIDKRISELIYDVTKDSDLVMKELHYNIRKQDDWFDKEQHNVGHANSVIGIDLNETFVIIGKDLVLNKYNKLVPNLGDRVITYNGIKETYNPDNYDLYVNNVEYIDDIKFKSERDFISFDSSNPFSRTKGYDLEKLRKTLLNQHYIILSRATKKVNLFFEDDKLREYVSSFINLKK